MFHTFNSYPWNKTPRRRCQVSRAAPRQETYILQTFSQNLNKWELHSQKCIGYLDAIHFCECLWVLGRKSELSTNNTLLTYEAVLKSIWANGIQPRGTASTSNIEILERFQTKALCMIVDAPWFVLNMGIQKGLQTLTVKEETCSYSSQYNAHLSAHRNDLAVILMAQPHNSRWFWTHLPNDLPAILGVIVL
jgi:hypothetical protein